LARPVKCIRVKRPSCSLCHLRRFTIVFRFTLHLYAWSVFTRAIRQSIDFDYDSMCNVCSGAGYHCVSARLHCVSKNGPTLKRYRSKRYGSILMIFGRNIRKTLE